MTLVDSVAEFGTARLGVRLSGSERALLLELVTDAVTCELSGRGGEAYRAAQRFIEQRDDDSQVGRALAAGVALRDLDLLDVFVGRDVCHPAENIPIAVRWALDAGCDGETVLRAIAVAYEAQCRFADVVDLRKGGLHHVTAAAIAVPLIAMHLGLLAPERVRDALALAVARGPVLRSIARGHVSTAKAFAYPGSAAAAMEAIELARAGVTGPMRVLDDLVTMCGSDPVDVAAAFATEPLASDTLARIRIKRFPVQFSLQAVGHAGLLLHGSLEGRTHRIIGLEVEAGPRLLDNTVDPAKRHPDNRETADHSLFATLAIAVVEGALRPSELLGAAWTSDEARRLLELIEVGPFLDPSEQEAEDGMLVRVRAQLADGGEQVVTVPPDDGFVPIGGDGGPVRTKLREALSAAPVERVASLLSAIDGLPEALSTERLVEVLDAWPVAAE